MRGRTEEKRMKVLSKRTQRGRAGRVRERMVLFFSPPSIAEGLIFFSSSVVENPTYLWF